MVRIKNAGRLVTMAVLGVALLGSGSAFGEDAKDAKDKTLSGPKAESPDSKPKGEGRGFSGEHRPGDRHHELMHELLKDLGLSDAQKEQIHAIGGEFRTKMQKWREEHKDEIQKLREEAKAAREAKDRDKGREAMTKLEALRKSGPDPKSMFDEMGKVLNEEQRAKFEERLKEHRERMEKRREMWRDGEGRKGPEGDRPKPKRGEGEKGGEKKKEEGKKLDM